MKYYNKSYITFKGHIVIQSGNYILFRKDKNWHNTKGPAHMYLNEDGSLSEFSYWFEDKRFLTFEGNSNETRQNWRKYIKLLAFT